MGLDAQDKLIMEELEKRFTYHVPHKDQPERYQRIRKAALDLARLLMETCPHSRERSTAFIHLDSVVMFANASIARHEDTEA
jgi:hypothetical protein